MMRHLYLATPSGSHLARWRFVTDPRRKNTLRRKKAGAISIRGYTGAVKITVSVLYSTNVDCSGSSRIARDPTAPSDSSMNRIPLSPRWGFPTLPAIVLCHRVQWDAGLTLPLENLWAALPPPGITRYRSQPPYSAGCWAYSYHHILEVGCFSWRIHDTLSTRTIKCHSHLL